MRARVRAVAISPSRSTRSMVPTGKKGRMILMLPRERPSQGRRTDETAGWGRGGWLGRGLPVRGVLWQRAEDAHLLENGRRQIEACQENDLAALHFIQD